MSLVYSEINEKIIEEEWFSIFSIENKFLYEKAYRSLKEQLQGNDGGFCYSESGKELLFQSKVDFITDPFNLSINDRKSINSVYSYMENSAKNSGTDMLLSNLVSSIHSTIQDLILDEVNITYNDNSLTLHELLKYCGVKIEFDSSNKVLETICNYIQTATKFSSKELFILANFQPFFEARCVKELSLFALREEIKIVMFEGRIHEEWTPSHGKILIVDEDLCEITRIAP